MSEYTVIQAEYTDAECIKAALKEMGYPFTEHEEATNLYGYAGDRRSQKAHIIINRKNIDVGANDIGFVRNDQGKYELIISEYDRTGTKKQAVDFTQHMLQLYSKHKSIKQLKKMGLMIASVKSDDGRIKIKAYAS